MDIDENAPGNMSQQEVTRTTDNETGHDPRRGESEVPLAPDDEAPLDEDMTDVAVSNRVSSEHPQAGTHSGVGEVQDDPQAIEREETGQTSPDLPASDPESGA
ncbi:hypothetical protein HNO86_16320 [Pseudomonas sp. C1C7]|uniref:hypothetical protein n=1 Tax=Pseudomonas sp. C1C7 TaxID=2735272 RepID=UPI001586E545|nr:hypothetical protein [Pseudomonas sp. C1C7]